MGVGWILISRNICNHWVWCDALKLKWWLDLIMMASHEDRKVMFRGHVVELKRGQLIVSNSYLRKRWEYIGDNGKRHQPTQGTIIKFLRTLEQEESIEISNEALPNRTTLITILNYNKYQIVSSCCDAIPNNTPDNTHNNTHNNEIKELKELNNNKKNNIKKEIRENFKPPTVEEVRAYVAEKNYSVDADAFVDFYTSKGWMVGKNKMKDWKSAVRTWQRNRHYDTDNANRSINQADAKRKRGEEYARYINDLLSDPRGEKMP